MFNFASYQFYMVIMMTEKGKCSSPCLYGCCMRQAYFLPGMLKKEDWTKHQTSDLRNEFLYDYGIVVTMVARGI